MKRYQDFVYNPDFEWYETAINLRNETTTLLVPDYITDDFPTIHQRFFLAVKWIEQQRKFIEEQCLERLLGFVPKDYETNQLKIRCISLEKEQCFELLLQHTSFRGYITLLFDKSYQIKHFQLDY